MTSGLLHTTASNRCFCCAACSVESSSSFRLILTIAGTRRSRWRCDAAHVDSDAGFQALTIQGISSFFAMFGVVGYTLYHNASLGMLLALVGAVAAGVRRCGSSSRFSCAMLRLQSSGTVSLRSGGQRRFGLSHGVARTAAVCRSTSPIACASSRRCRPMARRIPTGTAIRVQSVSANTLVVAPIAR